MPSPHMPSPPAPPTREESKERFVHVASGKKGVVLGGEESMERFVHVASGRVLSHHPLLPVYRRLLAGELKRKRGSRAATLTCHEWLLVAVPVPGRLVSSPRLVGTGSPETARTGGSGLQPMWINLVTGRRTTDFPNFSGQLRDDLYQRRNGWTEAQRRLKAFYELSTLRQMVGKVPSSRTMTSDDL